MHIRFTRWAAIALAIGVVGCGPAQPTAQSIPAAASAATMPAATSLPRPTTAPAAAHAPTSAPMPTIKPTPDAAAIAFHGAMVHYSRSLSKPLHQFATGLASIRKLSKQPVLGDATWNKNMRTAIAEVRDARGQLKQVTPPQAAQALHGALLDATAECMTAMDHEAAGVEHASLQEVSTGTDYMSLCSTKANAVTRQMVGTFFK